MDIGKIVLLIIVFVCVYAQIFFISDKIDLLERTDTDSIAWSFQQN